MQRRKAGPASQSDHAAQQAKHEPVLLAEIVDALQPQPEGIYIDATFGAGGHSRAILDQMPESARLFAIDCDPIAAAISAGIKDERFTFVRGNFAKLDQIMHEHDITEAAGVVMDLGMSSMQLADASRGLSFASAGPLDMRLDPDNDHPLERWLRRATEREIGNVIRKWGQERNWRRIASSIVAARRARKLASTADLATACESASMGRGRIHPATRTFQALRIFTNREMQRLASGLAAAAGMLRTGGRLAVISFHSLEDGIVRDFFSASNNALAQPALRRAMRLIRPTPAEVKRNPRSRSARLRVAERT